MSQCVFIRVLGSKCLISLFCLDCVVCHLSLGKNTVVCVRESVVSCYFIYRCVCVSSLGLCLSAKHFCVFAVKHVTQSFSPIRI